jgi:hypothetical protein
MDDMDLGEDGLYMERQGREIDGVKVKVLRDSYVERYICRAAQLQKGVILDKRR